MPMNSEFYLNKKEPVQGTLLALQSIILGFNPDITEGKKYGMPVFMYKDKNLVYLWTDKKSGYPYILFVDGNLMDHPKLEEGDRKRMKVYVVDPTEDIDKEEIEGLLREAVDLIR